MPIGASPRTSPANSDLDSLASSEVGRDASAEDPVLILVAWAAALRSIVHLGLADDLVVVELVEREVDVDAVHTVPPVVTDVFALTMHPGSEEMAAEQVVHDEGHHGAVA